MKTKSRKTVAASRPVRPFAANRWILICSLIPVLGILWVWLSSLSFVPVPWPDDSAFYFPAKDLFAWPPRWVMIPQAPFEPTYRIWNFNTMPLLPVLIGIARALHIDGSHALKLIPLGGWFLSCFFVVRSLAKESTSKLLLLGTALVFTFDPILRWSSVLVRPESLIGFCGIFILFGYRFGFPDALRERKFFHPVSLALAAGAYLHFNAIHLVPVVIALYWNEPRKFIRIGLLTALYLVPWLVTIPFHPVLFAEQMELQFTRLSGFKNPWLGDWKQFTGALHQDMGSPEPWSETVRATIETCVFLIPPMLLAMIGLLFSGKSPLRGTRAGRSLVGALVWLACSTYLWHTKAEVWFTHYMHLSFFAWAALVLHESVLALENASPAARRLGYGLPMLFVAIGGIFLTEQYAQAERLGSVQSWKWGTYDDYVACIEKQLAAEDERIGHRRPFRVFAPTFPDILIELSRKHPDWEFARTNDFFRRWNLGVQLAKEAEAVVVPETFRPDEEFYSGPMSERPNVRSVWMNWDGYYLIQLERDPDWKPRRYLCQRGRWDAFIYLPAAI
jgi:hypothetical protein